MIAKKWQNPGFLTNAAFSDKRKLTFLAANPLELPLRNDCSPAIMVVQRLSGEALECELTACTPGSAPDPTLGKEMGELCFFGFVQLRQYLPPIAESCVWQNFYLFSTHYLEILTC